MAESSPQRGRRSVRIGVTLLLGSAAMRFVEATIDNDVQGIFRLSYKPHALAARILEFFAATGSLIGLLFLGVAGFCWAAARW